MSVRHEALACYGADGADTHDDNPRHGALDSFRRGDRLIGQLTGTAPQD
jgi:hypothetical protein